MISLSAISESIMDKIQFHYDKSIFSTEKYNQLFWNPIESWKNKWKDDLKICLINYPCLLLSKRKFVSL